MRLHEPRNVLGPRRRREPRLQGPRNLAMITPHRATRGPTWTGATTSGRRSGACCQTPRRWQLAVAAELGEPLDDVRPSVLIGTIALNGQLGPEAAAAAAIEAELGRLQSRGRHAAARSAHRRRLARRPPGQDAGSRGRGFARPRDDRGGPARLGSDRGADRPPHGRPAAPLRGHPAPDLGALRRGDGGGPTGRGHPRGLRPLPPAVERADLARRHRRLPGRRARHPRPSGRGPARCARRSSSAWSPTTPRAQPDCAAWPSATAWTPTGGTASSRSRRAPRAIRSPSGRASARRSSRSSQDGSATCSG